MVTQSKEPEELTVSTGVVFRLRAPSAWALTDVQRQMRREEPQPPVELNELKGRSEPNEAHPAYQAAMREHDSRLTERLYEVVIATGTVLASVPDGFLLHTDEAWRAKLLAVGITFSDDPERAYIEWVKYYAAPTNADWVRLYSPLLRKVGTAEEDVAAATATFRGVPERPTDNEREPAGVGQDRD